MLNELPALLNDAAALRASLQQALKLLAEMQRNRSIAPHYKRTTERLLSSDIAKAVLQA